MTNYQPDAVFYEGSDIELEQDTRTLDLQLPSMMNSMFIGLWVICLLAALAIISRGYVFLGILIVGIPTFIGMVLKPTFALSMVAFVLPIGAGYGIEGMVSLDRFVGIALVISFLLNIMLTRPRFKVSHSFLLIQMALVFWIAMNLLRTPVLSYELVRVFSQIQLLALTLITYWILQNSDSKTYIWVLRSYVVGTVGSMLIGVIKGVSMTETLSGRYEGAGEMRIDPNGLCVLVGLGVITSLYLLVRDKSLLWRLFYLAAITYLPIMMVKTGSRGIMLAFIVTILSPLLFVRQMAKKPVLYLVLIFAAVIMAGAMRYTIKTQSVEEEAITSRYSDVGSAQSAYENRLSLVQDSIKAVLKNPLGTTFGGWFAGGAYKVAHNNFFHLLGTCGYPGALLYVLLLISVLWVIRRISPSIEKIYARSVVIFLIIAGMDLYNFFDKSFWLFMIVAICAERMNSFYHRPPVSNTDEYQMAVEQDNSVVWQT